MIRKTCLYIILTFSFIFSGYSQTNAFCGTELYEEFLLKNPQYQFQTLNEEKAYRFDAINAPFQERNDIISLPVVFHLIHDNGPENISDEQIIQGLEYLNQAFENTGPYYNEFGVNTKILFCLAQRDENGNEFSGIVRHESSYTDMSIFEGFDYVNSRKIDSTRYINIQIVKEACLGSNCSFAGFAGDYRIVIEANTLNNTPKKATILIHEMGHYLGLRHTFHGGCKNDDCLSDGDKVCDTPPDNRTYDGCSDSSNSCSTDEDDSSENNPFRSTMQGGLGDQNDDQTNFMDYNIESCLNKFTQGQGDRMHFFIGHKYSSLLESKTCLPPCENVVSADFILPDSITIGGSLTVINQSFNANNYKWYINGDSIDTSNDLFYSFDEIGLMEVTLAAFSIDTLCETSILSKLIQVYCPVEACFDYDFNEQYLVFEDCSENTSNTSWVVFDGSGDTIQISSFTQDSIYVNNIDFVKICLEIDGDYCNDRMCEYITITNDGSEVCGNEQDDDGDGLIDLFDPDCPCEDGAYQAHCSYDCEIIPDNFPDIKMKVKWESGFIGRSTSNIVVGDINGDNETEIFSVRFESIDLFNANYYATLIYGPTGVLINEKKYDFISGTPAIVDTNQDGLAEIIIPIHRETKIMDSELNTILNSEPIGYTQFNSNSTSSSVTSATYQLSVADLNSDGITEILRMRHVINGQNGNILFEGEEGLGCNGGTSAYNCGYSNTIAADVIESNDVLEVIAGKTVYIPEFNNLNDSIGNQLQAITAVSPINDGLSSVADIDGDGKLDVIIVGGSDNGDGGGIWIWNPRDNELIASANAGERGGVAAIGDIDGDCMPEIAMTFRNELRVYRYVGTQDLELTYSLPTSDNSGFTGVTMFDFNQDGKQELIYRDETSLKLIEGETGLIIDSVQIFSNTGLESPIIADIDDDNQAEILIVGTMAGEEESKIYCFESATTPWAPARSVWNQYAYNPTQVNDDLTIPRYQQNAAQPLQGIENCPRETCNTPYNNFMVQATMRTQEGCYVWPELQRDLSVKASSKCIGDSIEVCLHPISNDTLIIRNGVTVSCYLPPWENGSNGLLDSLMITSDTSCIMMPQLPGIDSLMIVINDEGGYYQPDFPNTEISECDYSNNEFVLYLGGPDFQISVIDQECNPDSLIFYIAVANVGVDSGVNCINGACYLSDPYEDLANGLVLDPLESRTWCFEYDISTMKYLNQDTFRVALAHPIGQSQIWWTVNDEGFAPGAESSNLTGIYECNYENNIASVSFDISIKNLNLGPDIFKCHTEVFTINAGSGFESYLWNDLTTDSIYSAVEAGLHTVEVTDYCNRVYRDTLKVIIDESSDINLGPDINLCFNQDTTLTIEGDYDQVLWTPTTLVDCDTCMNVSVDVSSLTTFYIQARKGNCISYDSIILDRIIPEMDTMFINTCSGDTINFQGQTITSSGIYEHLALDCSQLDVLDVIFTKPDSTEITEQICSSDSILFNGEYLNTTGIYEMMTQNMLGCDSSIILRLEVVNELVVNETLNICQFDSVQIFGNWITGDTSLQQIFTASSGCDSIQTYSVVVNPLPMNNLQFQICEGDSIYLYNEWYSNDDNYNIWVPNSFGCDSLISVELTIKENFETYDTLIVCQGDTVQIFGETITSDKDVWEYSEAVNGCDSVSNYKVIFVDFLESSEEVLLCPGDSIEIGGNWVMSEGQYETFQTSMIGCDSVHIIYVGMVNEPPIPETDIDCENLEILLSINSQTIWKPIWSNGDTSYQTNYSNGILEATLDLYSQPNCTKQFTITLPQLPEIDQIPILTDTIVKLDHSIEIDLGLNPFEWSVLWNNAAIVNCDTCIIVEITPIQDTEISIYLEHKSGCTYESTFMVKLLEEETGIYAPNIFSPNGDNNNDEWTIFTSPDIHISQCSIYDRWGNLVFFSSESQPFWDGKINGQYCEQGIYVYFITFVDSNNNNKYEMAGDLTLIR